jgi:hypothetical protein
MNPLDRFVLIAMLSSGLLALVVLLWGLAIGQWQAIA